MTMTTGWGPTGAAALGPGLDAETREQLRMVLQERACDEAAIEAFLEEMDLAIGAYAAMRELHQASLPAEVRRQLETLQEAIGGLLRAVNGLGVRSRYYITMQDADALEQGAKSIARLDQATAKAQRIADKLPKRGRLPDHARINLAAHVAWAVRAHLQRRPTTTRAGLYEALLSIMIAEVNRRFSSGSREAKSDVKDLVARALKTPVRRTGQGSLMIGDPE